MGKRKKKGILNEFKEFVLRGNVVDLAVGVIIGSSFQTIIKSLVQDVISPLLGVITGGVDFTNHFILLYHPQEGEIVRSLAEAQALGPVFAYGLFLTSVINFLIMAIVIFFMIKAINMLNKTKTGQLTVPSEKSCPYCYKKISTNAKRCPYCTSQLDSNNQTTG